MKKIKLSPAYLSSFCLELHLIMKAGIPIGEGFSLLAEDEPDRTTKTVLNSLYEKSEDGMEPHVALSETGVFPKYMVSMVEIGVRTGYLESVFKALSLYYDRQVTIARSIKSAVVYPAILFVLMVAVIAVLVTEVLPIFSDVFSQLGSTMHPVAKAFMSFGAALKSGRYIILAVIACLVVCFVAVYVIPALKAGFLKFFDRVSSGTKLGRLTGTARFAAAMAMTISSGLDTDESLEMAEKLCSNSSVGSRIAQCRALISEGGTFAKSVSDAGLLSPLYCRMLAVGAKTGAADTVMDEIARRSEEDVSIGIERAIGRVEPALVIVMSLLVGLVLLSVMLPLMGIMSSIG